MKKILLDLHFSLDLSSSCMYIYSMKMRQKAESLKKRIREMDNEKVKNDTLENSVWRLIAEVESEISYQNQNPDQFANLRIELLEEFIERLEEIIKEDYE